MNIPLFTGFYPSQVVQDFVHQQYQRSKIHGQPGVANRPLSGKGPGSFVSRGCSTQKAGIYCGIVATTQQGANEVSAQLNMSRMLIYTT